MRGRCWSTSSYARGSISPTTTASPASMWGRSASSTPRGLCMCWPDQSASSKLGNTQTIGRCERRSTISCTRRFEHPDERLAGVHVRGACLEREALVAEPPQRLDDQRRLADPGLADDEDGSRPGCVERADECVHAPRCGCRRASRPAAPPGRSAARARGRSRRRSSPSATARARAGAQPSSPRWSPSISSRTSGCRPASSSSSSSAVTTSPATTAPRGSVRPPARAGCRSSPPPRSRARRNHGAVAVGERAQEQLAFAPLAALEAALRALRPARGGAGRPAAIAAMAPARRNFAPRSATSAKASSSMLSGSASSSTRRSNSSSTSSSSTSTHGYDDASSCPRSITSWIGVCFRLRTLRGILLLH